MYASACPSPATTSCTNGDELAGMDLNDENPVKPVQAVIVYDDAFAGQRAMGMLNKLLSDVGDTVETRPVLWDAALLDDPRWREHAAASAIAADLLILSFSETAKMLPVTERWVKPCLARKQAGRTAVIVLWGAQDGFGFHIERNQIEGCTFETNISLKSA